MLIIFKFFYDYQIYSDGRVYSLKTNKFLNGEITKHGYKQVTLYIDSKPKRFSVHKLVATLFCEKPKTPQKLCINHIDGNKLNNDYSNLEWCTYEHNNAHARKLGLNNVSLSNSLRWQNEEFRKKTSNAISCGKKGIHAGRKNPNCKYLITIDGEEITPGELANFINLSRSYTEVLIRRFVNGISNKYFEKHKVNVTPYKE